MAIAALLGTATTGNGHYQWTRTTFESICTRMTHGFCDTEDSASLQNAVYACIDDISAWMRSKHLQLNAAKTEVMWCASSRRMHQVPAVLLHDGADNITPISSVRDLGIFLDANASMTSHISRTAASCFGILRQLRSVQRSLPRHAVVSLVPVLC